MHYYSLFPSRRAFVCSSSNRRQAEYSRGAWPLLRLQNCHISQHRIKESVVFQAKTLPSASAFFVGAKVLAPEAKCYI
jgi:hypothetical protein